MDKNISITNIKNNLRKWVLLIFLIVIMVVIAYFRVKIQIDMGAPYDTYDFLANAAEFAGKSIGYTDIRPPFISFLTSIIFRFQNLSIAPIFYVDAIVDILGVIGLYFLLKLRFNDMNSFLGSLLYGTFPIILTYMSVGYPDLPCVAISIWVLYFTVLAVKRDSRFFLLSFPLAMIAFLTRYNMALIIFPMFLYILINWQDIKKPKNIAIGIILSLLVILPFLIFSYLEYGSPLSSFLNFYGTSAGSVSDLHFDYNPDLLFYVKLFPFIIGDGALIAVLIIIGGILLGWLRLVKGNTSLPPINDIFKERSRNKLLIVLVLTVIFLISLGSVPYLLSEVIFFILCLVLFKMFKYKKDLDLDFLFFSWIMTFLIFSSVYLVKDIRYFLTMMPPFAYFLIRGLCIVENQVGLIKQRKLTFYLAPLLVVVIILSTSFYLLSIPQANEYNKALNTDMEAASQWLINYDPSYKSKVIYSDLWPHSGWFLQTYIYKMPQFKDNATHYNSLKEYNPSIQDSEAANNFLVVNNAYYYFSIYPGLVLRDFKLLKRFGVVSIYQRAI